MGELKIYYDNPPWNRKAEKDHILLRIFRIFDLVMTKGYVTTKDLVCETGVSYCTARNSLKTMESAEILERMVTTVRHDFRKYTFTDRYLKKWDLTRLR